METVLIKKGLINVPGAGGLNSKVDAVDGAFRGQTIICEDNTVTPPVNILPPIPTGACVYGVKQASQAEVAQIAFIGRTTETIVESTRYRIEIWNGLKREDERQSPFKYAYTSDAVLSGTPATDRVNVYTALQNKINAYAANNTVAYIVSKVAYTLGKTAIIVVGETLTQSTSGATVVVAANVQTGGTVTGGDAVGFIYVCNLLVAAWDASSETLTGGTSTGVMTTAAALTAGEGLLILDDAGYYGYRPNGKRVKSDIALTQGFDSATVEITASTIAVGSTTGVGVGLPGIYSVGIGTRMLNDIPVFTPDGVQIVSGEAWMQTNALPIAGNTYTTYWMKINEYPSDTNIDDAGRNAPYWIVLWVDEVNDTHLSNFETAIETGLGITFS